MLYTTAVLVFGFAIYSLSSVASLTKFGLLVSLTLVLGCVTEYLITPALILLLDRFGLFRRREPAPPVVAAHPGDAQT
jgi:predicted RND superfamily exporter protein